MIQHDVFDDRQAEAGAARFARAGAVHSIEALKKPSMMLGGDTGAVVPDIEFHLTALILCFSYTQCDLRVGGCVLACVFNQVCEHLLNCVRIGDYLLVAGALDEYFFLMLRGAPAKIDFRI